MCVFDAPFNDNAVIAGRENGAAAGREPDGIHGRGVAETQARRTTESRALENIHEASRVARHQHAAIWCHVEAQHVENGRAAEPNTRARP